MLTGKAEIDFDNYLLTLPNKLFVDNFWILPESTRWVTILDWAESIGIDIWIAPFFNHDLGVMNEWGVYYDKMGFAGSFPTRPEAREEAIRELNKIYNNGTYRKIGS